jgi:hypothetical protein
LRPIAGTPCPCCGKPMKKPEFDHCHETGTYRGYVCKDCNVGFGKLGDNVDGLIKAIRYMIPTLSENKRNTIIEELKNII